MSSGNIDKRLFVDNISGIVPQSAFEAKCNDFFNSLIPIEIEPVIIVNPFYQKAAEIHQILYNNQNLSSKQKLEFCSLGRYFIKQYLKDIIKKL